MSKLLREADFPSLYRDLIQARYGAYVKLPYFGKDLFTLIPIVREGLGTLAVDQNWRVYIDPDYFVRCQVPERSGVYVHEMYHPLRLHFLRAERIGVTLSTRELWNIAADLEINPRVIADGLQLPPGGVFPKDFDLEEGLLAEEYFRQLTKDSKLGQAILAAATGQTGSGESGSGVSGIAEPWELPIGAPGFPAVTGQERVVISGNAIRAEAAHKKAGIDPLLEELIADLSGEGKIPWPAILRQHIRATLVEVGKSGSTRSFRRPSRRAYMSPIILPRLVANRYRLGVVLDTSGSMLGEPLRDAYAEVRNLCLTTGARTTVLCCDANAATAQDVFGGGAFSLSLRGGGGTDMRVGIKHFEKEFANDVDAVIVVSDGETPWPNQDEMPPFPLIAVIVGDGPMPPDHIRAVRADDSSRLALIR